MSVACLAAVAVRLISSRLKHPVLIRNVLSLGMVIGLMTVMTLFQGQTGQAQDLAALIQPIQTWLAPVYWLTMAMINGNLFALLKLIGLSSLVLILFLVLIAPIWNALNQKARTTPVKACLLYTSCLTHLRLRRITFKKRQLALPFRTR